MNYGPPHVLYYLYYLYLYLLYLYCCIVVLLLCYFLGTQNIPIDNSSVDIGLIVAGWQYLQYPEKVSLELSRIIKSDSLLIISFTNRAFWSKAPNIWKQSSDLERMSYVQSVLSQIGWSEFNVISEY